MENIKEKEKENGSVDFPEIKKHKIEKLFHCMWKMLNINSKRVEEEVKQVVN